MRLNGSHKTYRIGGLATGDCGCNEGSLGALPENLQNPLYPVGTLNSNFNQAISNKLWDTMKALARAPYPELPYAGAGVQNPWSTRGGPFTVTGLTVTSTPPAPLPVATSGGRAKGVGTRAMNGLGSLGATPALTAPFPYQIKNPFITGNNFWYTGQPTLNKNEPLYRNDAEEFLRSAVVDSDWDRVEAWLGWALRNGMTRDKLTQFDFGRYKWTGTKAAKKFYPFSHADIRSFYERFLKFTAVTMPADRKCIQNKYEMALKGANSSPRNQFILRLSDCPLSESWEKGLLKVVASIALPVALVVAAGAIAGAVAAGGAGGAAGAAGAAGASGAAGAGAAGAAAGAAGSAALIPAGIEVVTVAASALPVIGAGTVAATVGAGLASGALVAANVPPPLTAQPPPASLSPEPVIETVTVTGNVPVVTAPEAITIGAGLSSGAIVAASAPPAPLQTAQPEPVQDSDTIETVVTEGTRIPVTDPGLVSIIGPSIALDIPEIFSPEPPSPQYEDDPTLGDQIKTGLQDAAAQYGQQYVEDQLAQYLQDQLNHPPTQDDLDAWQDWIDDGGLRPGANSSTTLWPWLIVGGLAAAVVFTETKRGRTKHRRMRS